MENIRNPAAGSEGATTEQSVPASLHGGRQATTVTLRLATLSVPLEKEAG